MPCVLRMCCSPYLCLLSLLLLLFCWQAVVLEGGTFNPPSPLVSGVTNFALLLFFFALRSVCVQVINIK